MGERNICVDLFQGRIAYRHIPWCAGKREGGTHTQRHINKNEDGGREIQKYFSMRACIQTRSDQDEGKKNEFCPSGTQKESGRKRLSLSLLFLVASSIHPSVRPSTRLPYLP